MPVVHENKASGICSADFLEWDISILLLIISLEIYLQNLLCKRVVKRNVPAVETPLIKLLRTEKSVVRSVIAPSMITFYHPLNGFIEKRVTLVRGQM